MKAAVRSLESLWGENVETWRPETEDWAISVTLIAGSEGGREEESFEITVCSSSWIAALARRDGIVDGRHLLIVDGFNWPLIRSYIVRRVESCQGSSWDELAAQLSRLGAWEFEDYQN